MLCLPIMEDIGVISCLGILPLSRLTESLQHLPRGGNIISH